MPTSRARPPGRRGMALGLLIGLGCAQHGAAPAADGQLQASQAVLWHDNLLRLGDGVAAPPGLHRADTQSSTRLAASVGLRWGRQQLRATGQWRDERFARNERFDHLAQDLRLGLDWHAASLLSGSLDVARRRALPPFDAAGSGLLTRRTEDRVHDVDSLWRLGGAAQLRVDLRLGAREVRQDAALPNRIQDLRRHGVALAWSPGPHGSLALELRDVRGRYGGADEAVERFTSVDLGLRAELTVGGTGRLDLGLAQGRSRHLLDPTRDFSGPVAHVAWTWQPGAATRLGLRASQGHGAHRAGAAAADAVRALDDTRRERALQLELTYRPREALAVQVGLGQVERELLRAGRTGAPSTGLDRLQTARLAARWAPQRGWWVDCSVAHERQHGRGSLGLDLRATRSRCAIGVEAA